MPDKHWKNINKFRLFTIVGLSLLTSLSLSMNDELWRVREVVTAILQASIAGFAYLQCPTFKISADENGAENQKQIE